MQPSRFGRNTRGSGQSTRERMLAKLEANQHAKREAVREKASRETLHSLINGHPEYRIRMSEAQTKEQMDKLYQDFYQSHTDEIHLAFERLEVLRMESPTVQDIPRQPAHGIHEFMSGLGSSSDVSVFGPEISIHRASPQPVTLQSQGVESQVFPSWVEDSDLGQPQSPPKSSSPKSSAEASSPRTVSEPSFSRTPEKTSSPSGIKPSSSSPSVATLRNTIDGSSSPEAAGGSRQPPRGRQSRPNDAPDLAAESSSASVQSKSTGPVPTGWSLNDTRPRSKRQLSNKAEKKATLFKNYIRQGFSPADAATKLGPGSMLKPVKAVKFPNPSIGQFEIRLNQHDRLTFISDEVMKTVTILEIGGHT